MNPVVQVRGVGKAYRHYANQWSRLAEWTLPFGPPRHHLTWALRDVSFDVAPGEAVGIVGFNGAGKSTLLKVITGTTLATEGSVSVNGRISALLELGMGFHPEFTGRQNVYVVGQLRGLDRAEIDELLPSIEEFAEIGAYFDEPLRTYSSGMAVRLAFAVATARRPELLIVDEALSVGDAYFQHKSFARIRDFREKGTTFLIVSHDRFAIQTLCDRAILLHDGQKIREGEPEPVLDFYHALMSARTVAHIRQQAAADGGIQTSSGTGEAMVHSVWLEDSQGMVTEQARIGETVSLCVRFRVLEPLESLVVGIMIKDRLGMEIFGINTHRLGIRLEGLAPGTERVFRVTIPMNVGEAHYAVSVALTRSDSHVERTYEWLDRALVFYVLNIGHPKFIGRAWLPPTACIEPVAES